MDVQVIIKKTEGIHVSIGRSNGVNVSLTGKFIGGGGSEGGGESFSGSASDVTYDNSESGLKSTNV